MKWYDNYLNEGEVDRSANPTPGNKKAFGKYRWEGDGSIAKSGLHPCWSVCHQQKSLLNRFDLCRDNQPVTLFVDHASCVRYYFASVYDWQRNSLWFWQCSVIKVCSRNRWNHSWQDLIDVNSGPIATGEATIAEVGIQLFHEIIEVASVVNNVLLKI